MFAIAFMDVSAPRAEALLGLDARSFGAFYDDVLPRIYGYFLRRCGGSVMLAEDLTQDTFLAAVAELAKERRVTAPMAWIHGIARHKLLDHYRREQRDDRPLELASESGEVGEELIVADQAEARERAMAALAAVAASQRAALVLCYLDGYSVPEAARLLGKSSEAVESLLARGRRSFKRAYLDEAA
jgi:RNA polymerase sigma-70 factor, ECF subfamily